MTVSKKIVRAWIFIICFCFLGGIGAEAATSQKGLKKIVSGNEVTGIKLNKEKVTVKPKEKIVLKAEITSGKAANKKVKWTSGNSRIATVNPNGTVTAIKEGKAVITVSSIENPKKKAKCEVIVAAPVSLTIDGKTITIGQSLKKLKDTFGEPDRIDQSVYPFLYYVYNTKDYRNFCMVGVDEDRVVAFYSDCSEFQIGKFTPKMSPEDINKKFKSKIGLGEKSYLISSGNVDYKLFFDTLGTGQIVGVFAKENTYQYGSMKRTTKVIRDEEREIFDCCNSARVRHGLSPLLWSDLAASSALNHSKDMAERRYFDHNNPEGKTPFQRMQNVGIVFSTAAENIIAGYGDGISSNNGWLNSEGHRRAMLSTDYTYLGVGGAEGKDYDTYFTQNYYKQ